MKILLLGGSGRTGKLVIKYALSSGYRINCLVRNPQSVKTTNNRLTLIEGNPSHIPDMIKAMQGCEAVISVLNISRRSDFPWSKLRSPKTLLSEVMSNLTYLTLAKSIDRIIVCSAWGVSETKTNIPFWFGWLIRNSNIRFAYDDHERQENILRKTSLRWTIVRPTGLTNSMVEKKIIESYSNNPTPKLTISRSNLARYLVDAIDNENLIRKSPVIST